MESETLHKEGRSCLSRCPNSQNVWWKWRQRQEMQKHSGYVSKGLDIALGSVVTNGFGGSPGDRLSFLLTSPHPHTRPQTWSPPINLLSTPSSSLLLAFALDFPLQHLPFLLPMAGWLPLLILPFLGMAFPSHAIPSKCFLQLFHSHLFISVITFTIKSIMM